MSHYCVNKFAFLMTASAITVVMHNNSRSHLGLHYFSPNMVHKEVDRNGLKITQAKPVLTTVKPVQKGHAKKYRKLVFKTNYRLMQVGSIAECSSAILSTSIKQTFIIKIFVVSIFEWPFYTGFTVVLL